ncbi:MAG TPA: hypothetical protein ENK18_14990, partial [Deltaproteobacteria bacterium]|nr:hypothetical protein [Deltaproteobacteria bacterium]
MPLTVKTHIDELIVEVPRAHTLFDRAMWIGILISGCVFVFALLWRPPEGAPPPQTPWILSSPERCEGPMIPDACGEELIALWRVPSRDEVILALERGRLHTHFPAAFPTQERLPALPRAWGELEPGDQRLVQQILRDRPPTDHPALHHSPWLIASYLDPGGAPPPVALTTPSDVDLTALVE